MIHRFNIFLVAAICLSICILSISCNNRDSRAGSPPEEYSWVFQIYAGYAGNQLFVLDAEHVWTSDYPGVLFFYDGNAWSEQFNATPPMNWAEWKSFQWVYAGDADHVWLSGQIAERDESLRGTTTYDFTHVNDRAAIYFYDGAAMTKQLESPSSTFFAEISGAGNDRIWAGASQEEIYFYDGRAWSRCDPLLTPVSVYSIDGTDRDHVWGMGNSYIYSFDGSAWNPVFEVEASRYQQIFAYAPNDVWALSGDHLYSYDGTSWAEAGESPSPGDGFSSLTVLNSSSIWASRGNAIYFFNGSTWGKQYEIESDESGSGIVFEIAAADADHVWALTSKGIYFGSPK